MNWKKVVSVLLAGMMTLSMAACGDSASNKSADAGSNSVAGTEDAGSKETSGDDAAESGEKLVIWTLADDLIDFGEKFQEETGTTVETVVIEPADYPTKLQTALLAGETEPDIVVGEPQMLEDFFDAGYRIFASDAEINYFSGDSAWVVDNKLNVAQARLDYMDLCVELYQQDLTAYASQWATPWYMAMAGEVPLLTAETQWGTDDMNIWDAENFKEATAGYETTEVFAYGLPAWGVLTMRDHVTGSPTEGQWGVCAGPAYGFGGGTYIGISSNSERKELAWEFVKFCTLNEDTANWWIEFSQGDTVSLIPVLEAHKDDENAVYGNQKLYSFWLEQAQGIDYSIVTRYDKSIGDAWGNAISVIKTGEKTKEDAINEFYDYVESTFPEIEVTR